MDVFDEFKEIYITYLILKTTDFEKNVPFYRHMHVCLLSKLLHCQYCRVKNNCPKISAWFDITKLECVKDYCS